MISTIHREDPLVETIDNFLTDEECAHFINISKNNLEITIINNNSTNGILANIYVR